MRIALVSPTCYGALSPLAAHASLEMSFLRALVQLGHEVELVGLSLKTERYRWLRGKPLRALRTVLITSATSPMVKQRILDYKPHLVLVVKGNYLTAKTLRQIRARLGALMFQFHPDDFFNPDNTSSFLRQCVSIYDCMFTPRVCNVRELKQAGARRVEHLPFGYDPEIHRRVSLDGEEKVQYGSDVAFIGDWRQARQQTLEAVAAYRLMIWGNGWRQKVHFGSPVRSRLAGRPIYCHEMAKVMGASKICLGLLNVENRDLSSGRSYEIPACGGFLLAQRTAEHLQLFAEGREIECFDETEELRAKIDHYLRHDSERLKIAAAGHKKVWEMPCSYIDRMRRVLEVFDEMRP
ncbi:MAG: glycosyltransferase [Acidobacteria bacterium]|nr:glycosyltransferase [Acidobacteriota bacterium]